MASRAFVNVIAAVTVSGFVAEQLRTAYSRRPNNRTMLRLCDQTWKRVDAARKLWGSCTREDLRQIKSRLEYFEDKILRPKVPIPELTSIALGMLDDVLGHLTNPDRSRAIERLMASISAIHRYYDRRNDRNEDYASAGQIVDNWNKLIAA